MSDYEKMELYEQVARLTARIAELEERVAQLENNRTARPSVSSSPAAASGETGSSSPAGGEEIVAGIRSVLERLGEADVGQIRQELVKTGFPASLTRSDLNKILYRHTDLFGKIEGDAARPEWRLI